MIESRLKNCCEDCPHINIHYRSNKVFETSEYRTIIFCAHMYVCKYYHEQVIREMDYSIDVDRIRKKKENESC